MILIIYASDVLPDDARDLQSRIISFFDSRIAVEISHETALTTWPEDQAWDDGIIVLYGKADLSEQAQQFLSREIAPNGHRRPVLPVSMMARNVPPAPLNEIKSISPEPDRIIRRMGAMLGMSLRTRDQRVFISYRAVDGTNLAIQMEEFLVAKGYNVWRDDSKDSFDGFTSILPGYDVQPAIEKNLEQADIILLLDTPAAQSSPWIKLEVDIANGLLIPVLPIVVLGPKEKRLSSRFVSLQGLQRGHVVKGSGARLPDSDLDDILNEMEDFLCEVYRRKLRIPFIVEQQFTLHGYGWSPKDRIVYEALRQSGRLLTRVYSHCSHFEGIFDPALSAFAKHLTQSSPQANYALYVYDGELISDSQILDIQRRAGIGNAADMIILHNQEIAALLSNHFTSLSA